MVQQFSKSLAARRIEARSRSKKLAVRITEVVRGKHYRAKSQSGMGYYDLDRTSDGWTCVCDGYFYTNACKHLGALERRADREGWEFGKIAPVAREHTQRAA